MPDLSWNPLVCAEVCTRDVQMKPSKWGCAHRTATAQVWTWAQNEATNQRTLHLTSHERRCSKHLLSCAGSHHRLACNAQCVTHDWLAEYNLEIKYRRNLNRMHANQWEGEEEQERMEKITKSLHSQKQLCKFQRARKPLQIPYSCRIRNRIATLQQTWVKVN